MKQAHSDRKRRGGKHFTLEKRVQLETLAKALYPRGKKPNMAELARRLAKSRSAISREFNRGLVINRDSELRQFWCYSAQKGQDQADEAALNKGPRGKLTNHLAKALADLIVDWRLSPYVAVQTLKKSGQYNGVPCERTVYNAIDAGLLGVSREQLPYRPKKKPRGKRGKRMAYTNREGRSITDRPKEADERSEYGHWEMDTVVGGKGRSPACLLVLTERASRQQIIRKIANRTQRAVLRALNKLEREETSIFPDMKTITCDNGCEFLDPDGMERSVFGHKKRCKVFFAHPYTSSERGSNENANRTIRRFLPIGCDFSRYTIAQIQRIEDWINTLPRKLLDGLSAYEKLHFYFKKEAA